MLLVWFKTQSASTETNQLHTGRHNTQPIAVLLLKYAPGWYRLHVDRNRCISSPVCVLLISNEFHLSGAEVWAQSVVMKLLCPAVVKHPQWFHPPKGRPVAVCVAVGRRLEKAKREASAGGVGRVEQVSVRNHKGQLLWDLMTSNRCWGRGSREQRSTCLSATGDLRTAH